MPSLGVLWVVASGTALAASPEEDCTSSLNNIAKGVADETLDWSTLDVILRPDNLAEQPKTWKPATPASTWSAAVDAAAAKLDEVAKTCFSLQVLPAPEALNTTIAALKVEDPGDYIARVYPNRAQDNTGLLPQVIALNSGQIPDDQPVQFALTQVTSNGAPGFAPTLALAPLTNQPDIWIPLRHLTVNGSVLVINGPTTSVAAEVPTAITFSPVLSSWEVYAGFTTRKAPKDLYLDAAKEFPQDQVVERKAATTALRRLVTEYNLAVARKSSADLATADPVGRLLAVQKALVETRRVFRSGGDGYEKSYDKKYADKYKKAEIGQLNFEFRYRQSPDATYVPEYPDLISAKVGANGRLNLDFPPEWSFPLAGVSGIGSFDGAYSQYPTPSSGVDGPTFTTLAEAKDAGGNEGGWVLDGSFGLSVLTGPSVGAGPSHITVSGLYRGVLPRGGDAVHVGGVAASLEVPISGQVALVGAYVTRWDPASEKWIATSGLSMAVGSSSK